MITQIEIDGFKSFKDFKVELAPFQVIIGPNGSGKSNLFDAFQFLSHSVDTDLYSISSGLRGGGEDELFMKLPDGKTSNHMRFAIEMLVDRKSLISNRNAYTAYTRLRYELEIVQEVYDDAPDQLYVAHESLSVIPRQDDSWCKKYKIVDFLGNQPFYNQDKVFALFYLTQKEDKAELLVYKQYLNQDNLKKNQVAFQDKTEIHDSDLNKIDYTIMSRFVDFLTGDALGSVLAVREEFHSLRLLHLNPEALRQPSSTKAPRTLSFDGSNLPTALARMQAEDKYIIGDISRDMANLVPGILKIRVVRDKLTDRYAVQAKTSDQRTFSSHVLSDGTLRLLALATLKNDPGFRGVLCIEEPENGIDPLHLKNMASLLCTMATDFSDPEQLGKPLRQVIVTSHSPTFISLPEIINSLTFAFKVTRVEPQKTTFQVTRMVPIPASDQSTEIKTDKERDIAVEAYTIDQVRKYLESASFDNALEQLGRILENL